MKVVSILNLGKNPRNFRIFSEVMTVLQQGMNQVILDAPVLRHDFNGYHISFENDGHLGGSPAYIVAKIIDPMGKEITVVRVHFLLNQYERITGFKVNDEPVQIQDLFNYLSFNAPIPG